MEHSLQDEEIPELITKNIIDQQKIPSFLPPSGIQISVDCPTVEKLISSVQNVNSCVTSNLKIDSTLFDSDPKDAYKIFLTDHRDSPTVIKTKGFFVHISSKPQIPNFLNFEQFRFTKTDRISFSLKNSPPCT
jgi:hypothetical protein